MSYDTYYQIKRSNLGSYYFLLKHNGEVIISSELYDTKQSCMIGIKSVQKNCANPKRYKTFKTTFNKNYFKLIAGNGHEIARSDMHESLPALQRTMAKLQHAGTIEVIRS